MSLLGIDIGTTGCKAAVFSADGTMLHLAYREYPTLHPAAGAAELDSSLVWNSVRDVISEAASKTGADPVKALCVSSFGEGAVPVSSDRGILGNTILGSDSRGEEYVSLLPEQNEFFRTNPNILAPCYTMPKLCWLRDNQPDEYEKADHFLLWDGMIGFMLGCDPFITFSGANRTLLFDIHNEGWSDDLIKRSGLDRSKLPRCIPGGEIAGTVSDSAASELGLPKGVLVVAGGHDQCCNALGAGIAEGGKAVDGIGTFECIAPVYDHIPDAEVMLEIGLNVEHHVVNGLYTSFLYNQAGSLVKWFRDVFAADIKDDENVYETLNREMPDDPTDLLVLPYFEPSGSPDFVTECTGSIHGLKLNTQRGDILKAVMESVTFYFARHIGSLAKVGIDTSQFVATGGGAKSDRWLQIKADILGVPFIRPKSTECGIAGAAILAGAASGDFNSLKEGINALVAFEHTFEPDPDKHSVYKEKLKQYIELSSRLISKG